MIEALEIESKVIICINRAALKLYKPLGDLNDGKVIFYKMMCSMIGFRRFFGAIKRFITLKSKFKN